jgi:hypothetical protein
MAYATVADVEARLGRSLEAGEQQIVETRLNDVEILIRSRITDLDERIANGSTDLEALIMVEANAVLRLIKNIDGFRAETDGNYSYQIDDRVASGRLDILSDEWALLGLTSGVFTIRTNLSPFYRTTPPDPWVTL